MFKQMLSFDAVVATYNRPEKVTGLVRNLNNCNPGFTEIIVIDSSDSENTALKKLPDIRYVRSNHKNQPYQRFLGYLYSKSDVIVYFDDDMEILDYAFLSIFGKEFINENIVGLQAKMRNKHDDSTIILKASVFSRIWSVNNSLVNLIRWLTMYPRLKPGKFWYCGLRGDKPDNNPCLLEWVSGWAFAAKRSALFKNINFQLFDLFENKIGMGEDLIIGHYLSKVGTVKYIPELLFLHNDQRNSSYTLDHFSFAKRTIFSRYFLSMEYARLNDKPFIKARLIFWYYAFFRVTGIIVNLIVHHGKADIELFRGAISGITSLFTFEYQIDRGSYWTVEIVNNLENV